LLGKFKLQIAAALEYRHSAGAVHLDVKPGTYFGIIGLGFGVM